MKNQEIRDPETDDQREKPSQNRKFHGLEIKVERQSRNLKCRCNFAASGSTMMPPNPSLCRKLAAMHDEQGGHKEWHQHEQQRRYVNPAQYAIARGHDASLVRIFRMPFNCEQEAGRPQMETGPRAFTRP